MVTALAWLAGIGSCNVSMIQLGRWQLLAAGWPSILACPASQAPQLLQAAGGAGGGCPRFAAVTLRPVWEKWVIDRRQCSLCHSLVARPEAVQGNQLTMSLLWCDVEQK